MRKALVAALAAVVSLSVFAAGPASATDTGKVTQLSDGNNKSTVPAISGNGELVVFHSVATNLVNPPPAADSTDDTVLADLSGASTLFTMPEEDGTFPDISENGRYIVYTRNFENGDPSQVVRFDRNTSAKVVTTGNDDSGDLGQNIAGARVDNGGNVVFSSLATNLTGSPDVDATDGLADIYYWTGSGNATKLTDDATAVNFYNPDISATGGIVVFDDGSDIFSTTSAGGVPVNETPSGNGSEQMAKLSSNGSVMAFRSDSDNLDGGNNTFNVTTKTGSTFNRVTNFSGAAVTNPAISGDGAYVAYTQGSQVRRSRVSDGTTIQVSNNNGAIDYPSVSTDGSVIAFAQSTATSPPGDVEIFVWHENAAPEAPAAPTAVADSDTAATVTFTPPADNGSAITGYKVVSSPGGIEATGASSPIQVTGLTSSTAYTFTVVASNANGDSPASPASNQITTEDTPGAPAAPTAAVATATGETTATVTFTAPTDNGGSAITGYTVTANPGGKTATGAASPIIVTGLTESTSYTFTVTATNAVGTGPASAASGAVTTDAECGPILTGTYSGASGINGRIARLYAAYFLRNPDAAGFQFWQARISAGDWTNDNAATFFSESGEFNTLYGKGLSNEAFIDLLYENSLCRTADAGGKAFWLNRMNNEGWSRGQVALGFSDAPEFRTRTGTS